MKKLLMLACVCGELCCGMQPNTTENQLNSAALPLVPVVQNIPNQNGNLQQNLYQTPNQTQMAAAINANVTPLRTDLPNNLGVQDLARGEGRCWYCAARILQPLQIFLNAGGAVIASMAAIYSSDKPKTAKDLIITTALTSAVSSAMGILLSKMDTRVADIDNALNPQPAAPYIVAEPQNVQQQQVDQTGSPVEV